MRFRETLIFFVPEKVRMTSTGVIDFDSRLGWIRTHVSDPAMGVPTQSRWLGRYIYDRFAARSGELPRGKSWLRSDLESELSGLADGDPFTRLDLRAFTESSLDASSLMELVGEDGACTAEAIHYRTRGEQEAEGQSADLLRELQERFAFEPSMDVWFDADGRLCRIAAKAAPYHAGILTTSRVLEVVGYGFEVVVAKPPPSETIDEFDLYQHPSP